MKNLFPLIGIVVVAVALMISSAMAQTEAKPAQQSAPAAKVSEAPKTVNVTGTVKVTKNADGKVTDITLSEASGTSHKVVLDDNGNKLSACDGKKVEVTGTLEKSASASQLKVSSYKEVKEEAQKEM